MSTQTDLLIEIGMEELPPKALVSLRDAFKYSIIKQLEHHAIQHHSVKSYATPRRLALLISEISKSQADQVSHRRGPSVESAFDAEGNFTNAAIGFARSCGVSVESLERVKNEKGEWLYFTSKNKGVDTKTLLPKIINDALMDLPAPKRMLWGNNTTAFVRPVHWLVVLLGEEVVDMQFFGIQSGRLTRGHRFHNPEPILLDSPGCYSKTLFEKGWVIADHDKRVNFIKNAVKAAADSMNGVADIDKELINEVAALVEWPVTLIGHFNKRFLRVPPEALISSMKGHQKFFPVTEKNSGDLLPKFITVTNIHSKNPDVVIKGNERVIHPRLADAEFFWLHDKNKKLSNRVDDLKNVTYQRQLGTLYDKCTRVAHLAASMADCFNVKKALAIETAMLSKCDLLTEMVGEFPELQGVMGRYYALDEGYPTTMAVALEEQYLPKFAGDRIPTSALGSLIGCADRLDTLVSIFSIGSTPTGDKDPYALRRCALSILRILIEGNWEINLDNCLKIAVKGLPSNINDLRSNEHVEKLTLKINNFLIDRLKGYYLDQGYSLDQFEAVLNAGRLPNQVTDSSSIDNVVDFNRRLKAVRYVADTADFKELLQINKRVHNILKKIDCSSLPALNKDLLHAKEEKALFISSLKTQGETHPLIYNNDYVAALLKLTFLKSDLVNFFESVMVMDDDLEKRNNRLNLLYQVYTQLNQCVNLAQLDSK